MKKNITLRFQKNGSVDCGPVSSQMILSYFGMINSLENIKSQMSMGDFGTYIYDNGLLFLEHNLKATLITANPLIFKNEDLRKLSSEIDIKKHLSKIIKKKPKLKKPLHLFKKYIDAGGKVLLKIPTIIHIQKALDKNKLILALIYGGVLGTNEGGFHFVVVSGYKKNHVHIHNPLKKSKQGWFKNEDFIYALHSSTCADVDNGSLLIVG